MIIQSLELQNFRNYETLKLFPGEKVNIFFGKNAQGKTNILESIYVSGTSKSHRLSKDKEMIAFGSEEAHIKTMVEKNNSLYQIDYHLKKNKKKGIAVNRIPLKKASEIFGILNVVVFSPEDLDIIKDGPALRRKFMDAELCQIDKVYLYDLTVYQKALLQRNKLLKELEMNPRLMQTLDVWDDQLMTYGEKIIVRREQFINEINEIIGEIHLSITGGKEKLKLVYHPNSNGDNYRKEFKSNRQRDLRFAQTHVGPHKDELEFYINGNEVRKFGSQGQQRTAVLSLKIAEIEIVKKVIHDQPVLLLDDVLSELDKERQTLLLNHIGDIQTFITCTGVDEFIKNRLEINRIYRVDNEIITEYQDIPEQEVLI